MTKVDALTALNELFFNNRKVYVEHNTNNIYYTQELKLGSNIAMTTEIPVTVLLKGKWYLVDEM